MKVVARLFCVVIWVVIASRGFALDLPVNAVQTAQDQSVDEIALPLGERRTGSEAERERTLTESGVVTRRAWRVPGSLTSFQMMDMLRTQVEHDGFDVLFSCADTMCGGFLFRFDLDLLPPPDMFVDLGDFQYLVGQDKRGATISIVTSRSREAGFVHITEVASQGSASALVETEAVGAADKPLQAEVVNESTVPDIVSELERAGHVALDDLAFGTGAATLGDGPFASLAALAEYLATHPQTQIVLVGHTDNVGALEVNVALSRRRAEAVRDRMIDAHGADPNRITADGVGYLAPRVSNGTEMGRDHNRRVEAVLAPTPDN